VSGLLKELSFSFKGLVSKTDGIIRVSAIKVLITFWQSGGDVGSLAWEALMATPFGRRQFYLIGSLAKHRG